MVGARLALDTLRRECRCRQRGRGKSDIKSDMLGHAVPLTSIGKRSGMMAKNRLRTGSEGSEQDALHRP
jgi:hypothetical protein